MYVSYRFLSLQHARRSFEDLMEGRACKAEYVLRASSQGTEEEDTVLSPPGLTPKTWVICTVLYCTLLYGVDGFGIQYSSVPAWAALKRTIFRWVFYPSGLAIEPDRPCWQSTYLV